MMFKNGMRPIHPGEILRERRGITPDTALQLAAFFGGDASSWLNLQQAFDLKTVDKQVIKRILKEVIPLVHA